MEDTERDVRARLTWDAAADAGYVSLVDIGPGEAVHQRVVGNPLPGLSEVVLDFDAAGRVLGVEFLGDGQLPPALAPW